MDKLISNNEFSLDPLIIKKINDNQYLIAGNSPSIG